MTPQTRELRPSAVVRANSAQPRLGTRQLCRRQGLRPDGQGKCHGGSQVELTGKMRRRGGRFDVGEHVGVNVTQRERGIVIVGGDATAEKRQRFVVAMISGCC